VAINARSRRGFTVARDMPGAQFNAVSSTWTLHSEAVGSMLPVAGNQKGKSQLGSLSIALRRHRLVYGERSSFQRSSGVRHILHCEPYIDTLKGRGNIERRVWNEHNDK